MPGSARGVHPDRVDSRNSSAKIPQAQGAPPRFLTSSAPSRYWKTPSAKSTANNDCLAVSSSPRAQLGILALVAQRFFAPRDLASATTDRLQRLPFGAGAGAGAGAAGSGCLAGGGSVCTVQRDAASEACACGINPGSGAKAFST